MKYSGSPFDGSIVDEKNLAVIGGRSEAVQQYLREHASPQPPTLKDGLRRCHAALEQVATKDPFGESRSGRARPQPSGRKFRRLSSADISQLFS